MSPGLPLFGLTVNPYDDHVLDPLARAEDADLFTAIDGFHALTDVDEFLRGRAAATGPTFVLVKGPDGSGRTSVANFVVGWWKVASAEERHMLLPRIEEDETRSARRLVGSWVASLRNEVRKAGHTLPDELDGELKDFFAVGCDSLNFAADLRYLLARLDTFAVDRGHWLVALFDNIDAVDLVPVAVEAFGETRALVVFVAGDYPSQLDPLLGEGGAAVLPPERSRTVHLSHLREGDIAELVRSRWEHAVKYSNSDVLAPPLPFDPDVVGVALGEGHGQPRTLRRVMNILHDLLEHREAALVGRRRVTDDQLRFTAEELDKTVRILDELSGEA